MKKDRIMKLLLDNPAGLSKMELWKLSGMSNKQFGSEFNSMLRSKEIIRYSGRVVLNNLNCVKNCLLEINMENICSICERLGIPSEIISEEKMKAWIDSYVEAMEWKDGKLVSKINKGLWEVADLYDIREIMAR